MLLRDRVKKFIAEKKHWFRKYEVPHIHDSRIILSVKASVQLDFVTVNKGLLAVSKSIVYIKSPL